jgi:hypothetical protein
MALSQRCQDLQDEVRTSRCEPSSERPGHRPGQYHQPKPRVCGGPEKTLPANLRATHVSLFDNTLQGLARTDKPAFCFQGHPEASPGPQDISYLFDRFVGFDGNSSEEELICQNVPTSKVFSSSAPAPSSLGRLRI